METFSVLLAICARNSPVSSEFPTHRPVTRSFDVFFELQMNKRLSIQWWGWYLGHHRAHYGVIEMWNIYLYSTEMLCWYSYDDDSSTDGVTLKDALQWRHNECNDVLNHRRFDCLLNRLFGRRSKEISKLRVTGLCEGNPLLTGGFPHKGPVMRQMFQLDDATMEDHYKTTLNDNIVRTIRMTHLDWASKNFPM